MSLGRMLAVTLILTAALLGRGSTLLGKGSEENGGVIILRSTYLLPGRDHLSRTIIVVSSDAELAKVQKNFGSDGGSELVTIEGRSGSYAEIQARLYLIEPEHLSGQVLATGQTVHVVSFSYARRRGLI